MPTGSATLVATILEPAPTREDPASPQAQEPVRWAPLLIGSALALGLAAYVWSQHGAKSAVLLVLGLLLGFTLFHARFGFTSAWRQLVVVGNGQGLRAHTVLLGSAATLVMLVASSKTGLFGSVPRPSAGALGLALLLGAVLFAIGMQLGGACASGTLYAVGSGQSAIVLTLGGFIAGAVFSTWAYPAFSDWPQFQGVLLADRIGWGWAWAATMLALLGIALASKAVQRLRLPPPVEKPASARGPARVVRGSWPMPVGAVVLAALAASVFLVSGGTWGVTSAFGLWGAKILQALGLHPEHWAYWQMKTSAASLRAPVWRDQTSLTNIGIMVGAAIASAAAGSWRLHRSIPWRTALAAVLGGVLMGVGARMAGGCNIGAYLAGISVGSLHGWIWGGCALLGTWLGVRLRPLFGLANPKPTDGVC